MSRMGITRITRVILLLVESFWGFCSDDGIELFRTGFTCFCCCGPWTFFGTLKLTRLGDKGEPTFSTLAFLRMLLDFASPLRAVFFADDVWHIFKLV